MAQVKAKSDFPEEIRRRSGRGRPFARFRGPGKAIASDRRSGQVAGMMSTRVSLSFFGLAVFTLAALTACNSEKNESGGEETAPQQQEASASPAAASPAAGEGGSRKLVGTASGAPPDDYFPELRDEEPEESASEAPAQATKTMKTSNESSESTGEPVAEENLEVATLGGGCFWCVEAVMERLDGVVDVVSGYMGGHVENPTYEQVCSKGTGHAEVIQVTYDETRISFEEILDVFWQAHDPTTLNRQGADVGPQYRSVIFYHTPEQKNVAERSKAELDESGRYEDAAVTEIAEASEFWKAEDYHQDYYRLNKDENPYCRLVISPKMEKLGFE